LGSWDGVNRDLCMPDRLLHMFEMFVADWVLQGTENLSTAGYTWTRL
jgi:hypothetical protein